jgi:phosphate transport system substrate-binding protein
MRPTLRIGPIRLAFCLLLAACGTKVETPAPITITIGGSTSMLPLLHDLADAYQAQHPNVHITIEGYGSQGGVKRLRASSAGSPEDGLDLVASSWWPLAGIEASGDLTATAVARDGIALIVHPHNSVPGLTLLELQRIYAGRTLSWQEVGGPSDDIVVISREDGSGTRAAFEALVMGDEPVTLAAVVMPSSAAVVEHVAKHPTAIGYVSTAYLTDTVRALPIEGQLPTSAALRSGAYPLTRSLYLVGGEASSQAARAFVGFAVSPAGQSIVARRYLPRR